MTEQAPLFPSWPEESFASRLSEGQWHGFQSLGAYQKVGSGLLLYRAGTHATNLLIIISGTVTLTERLPHDGLVGVRHSGDLLGDREVLSWASRSPYPPAQAPCYRESACAITPVKVLRIPALHFNQCIEYQPSLWRAIAADLHCRLAAAEKVRAEGGQGAPRRLAQALLALWPRDGRITDREELLVTQGQLASWIGVSRETVERILRGWRSRGIVQTRYGRIEVRKRAKLQQLAGQDSSEELSNVA
ncbi:Crp/Fnr family transcriptional regulator [Nocardiopsis quinghaiensis]|uniref:Crp/Fnr family transcriptional regulator n=1 Tax=Nocardiopsis quinghaiensis TaxID=464995 RepID=UPI00123A4F73